MRRFEVRVKLFRTNAKTVLKSYAVKAETPTHAMCKLANRVQKNPKLLPRNVRFYSVMDALFALPLVR